jgi:uncharacterized membrane protein
MTVIAVIGLALASYLTEIHYSGAAPICATDACEIVQHSTYSKLAGVPVALIGLIGYVLILVSLLAPEREETRLATLLLTTVGFGFSLYLTGRELFSIHQICEECVSSAALMTILEICAVLRFLRGDALAGPHAAASAGTAKLEPHAS